MIVSLLWGLYFLYHAIFGALVFTQATPNDPHLPAWVKLIDEVMLLGILLISIPESLERIKPNKNIHLSPTAWFFAFVAFLIFLKGITNGWTPSMLRYSKNYLCTLFFCWSWKGFLEDNNSRALRLFLTPIFLSLIFGNLFYFYEGYNLYSNRSIGFYATPNTLGFVSFFMFMFSGRLRRLGRIVKILALVSLFLSGSMSALLMLFVSIFIETISASHLNRVILFRDNLFTLLASSCLFLLLVFSLGRQSLLERYQFFAMTIADKVLKTDLTEKSLASPKLKDPQEVTSIVARKKQLERVIGATKKYSFRDYLIGSTTENLEPDFEAFHFNWVKHFGVLNFLCLFYFLFILPIGLLVGKKHSEIQQTAAIFLVSTFLGGMTLNNIYEEAPAYVIIGYALVLLFPGTNEQTSFNFGSDCVLGSEQKNLSTSNQTAS